MFGLPTPLRRRQLEDAAETSRGAIEISQQHSVQFYEAQSFGVLEYDVSTRVSARAESRAFRICIVHNCQDVILKDNAIRQASFYDHSKGHFSTTDTTKRSSQNRCSSRCR